MSSKVPKPADLDLGKLVEYPPPDDAWDNRIAILTDYYHARGKPLFDAAVTAIAELLLTDGMPLTEVIHLAAIRTAQSQSSDFEWDDVDSSVEEVLGEAFDG